MCVPSIEVFFSLTAGKCVQSDHSMGARIYITFVETCIYLFFRTTTVLRGKTGCGRVAALEQAGEGAEQATHGRPEWTGARKPALAPAETTETEAETEC